MTGTRRKRFRSPEGMTGVEFAQLVAAKRREGMLASQIATEYGAREDSVRQLADMADLADNEGLPSADRDVCKEALASIVDCRGLLQAWRRVAPIAKRVHGSRRGVNVVVAERRRMEHFLYQIEMLRQTCEMAASIDPPAIPPEHWEKVSESLREADNNTRKLRAKLKEKFGENSR